MDPTLGIEGFEPLWKSVQQNWAIFSFPFFPVVHCVFPGSTVWHPDCKQSTKTEEKLRVRKQSELVAGWGGLEGTATWWLLPGLWGKVFFLGFFFLIEKRLLGQLRGLPPSHCKCIVIVVLCACVVLHQPYLTSQCLRKVSKGTPEKGEQGGLVTPLHLSPSRTTLAQTLYLLLSSGVCC